MKASVTLGERPGTRLTRMSTASRHVLHVIGAGMLFGTAGTAAALGPAGASSLSVGIIRILVGALVLLAVLPLLGGSLRRLGRLWRTPAMLVSASCAGVYQLCFFAGVRRAGVALGTLVAVGSAPIAAGLIGWVILGHRPTRGWLLSTLGCLAGLAMLSAPDLTAGGDRLGVVLALGAGLCVAGYNVSAKLQIARGVSTLEVPAASFVLASLVLLPVLATQPLGWLAQPSGVALALYLGAATMGLANVLLARGIRGLTPGPATTLMLADPAVATGLGVLVLGEVLAPGQILGMCLVLAGLIAAGLSATREAPGAGRPVEPAGVALPSGRPAG